MIFQEMRWRVYEKMSERKGTGKSSKRNTRTAKSGRKKKRVDRKRQMQRNIRVGLAVLFACILAAGVVRVVKPSWLTNEYFELDSDEINATKPKMDVELLTVNPYSRPGTKTKKIRGIVIHYTANPGATAMGNRNYFENLKDTKQTKASSNFIIGLEGEIVQCVPTWEVAYASNGRNEDTVSIECCHPDKSGRFTKDTYESMVRLTAWLCMKFDLTEQEVIRHYDVTGKNCPKYFVEDEKSWKRFRGDVKTAIEKAKQK